MVIEPWMVATLGLVVLFFWVFREIKSFLFWTYLWQLKNYHVGKFMAHFDTYSGKRLFNNPLSLFKHLLFICLLLLLAFSIYVTPIDNYIANYGQYLLLSIPLAFLIYLIEGFGALISIMRRRIKGPQLTSKIAALLPVIFLPLAVIAIVFSRLFIDNLYSSDPWVIFDLIPFAFVILAFDILTPLIDSLIILILQPITVILRGRIIRKAIKKGRPWKIF